MAMATVAALLAGCGGGAGKGASTVGKAGTAASTGTSTNSGAASADGRQQASATHGGFRTIFPAGYSNDLSAAGAETGVEYMAIGPRIGGFASTLTVFRGPSNGSDIDGLARTALHHLSQRPSFLPKVRGLSSLQKLRVDGAPALAIDYQLAGRKPTSRRQVFVIHGGWAYEISDITEPSQHAASLRALDEVIRSWRWQ